MFLNKDSIKIKISGGNFISVGQYITEAKYGYHKLFTDAGRLLSGKMSATLVGIFPKITLNFGRLNQTELELLMPIFDSARQIIQYYDAEKKTTKTINTYTNDIEITNKNIIDSTHTNEPFSVSFIATERRA